MVYESNNNNNNICDSNIVFHFVYKILSYCNVSSVNLKLRNIHTLTTIQQPIRGVIKGHIHHILYFCNFYC